MEYAHFAFNPEGEGLERVADVYVSKGSNISGKAEPSQVFRSLVQSKETSGTLRALIDEATKG